MDEVGISPPRALTPDDDLTAFDCGIPALNDWLRKRAMLNHLSGASRTYVAPSGQLIAAYYCLAAGTIHHAAAPGSIKRNMPEPIPAIVLGRLAVDRKFQGRSLGAGLLEDAIKRTHQIAELAGIRALLVHAKDAHTAGFYSRSGFVASPLDPLTLMIKISL